MEKLNKGDVLLLDIEGTTTSITFVKDVLFPYVRNNLKLVLDKNWDSDEFQSDIEAIRILSAEQMARGDSALNVIPERDQEKFVIIEAVYQNVIHWMDRDEKLTALKQLQGHIWRKAYQCGLIKSHLYPDVYPVLNRLSSDGIKIYIYSSGSVEAQKLLFAYSTEGDLQPILSGYFDTNIGLKTDCKSYTSISQAIGVEPNKILFLTDVEREAYPCREAGCRCVLIIREGNEKINDKARKDFQTSETFNFLIH